MGYLSPFLIKYHQNEADNSKPLKARVILSYYRSSYECEYISYLFLKYSLMAFFYMRVFVQYFSNPYNTSTTGTKHSIIQYADDTLLYVDEALSFLLIYLLSHYILKTFIEFNGYWTCDCFLNSCKIIYSSWSWCIPVPRDHFYISDVYLWTRPEEGCLCHYV